MIASLTGILRRKSPTEILLDVQGVGYSVLIPLSTYEKLPEVGSSQTLLTHMHVREDAILLFGFLTTEERELFRMLLSVSGIGPKIAQGILSGIPASDIRKSIANGNIQSLTSIPGVGRKTAERLVLELRDKVMRSVPADHESGPSSYSVSIREEALQALTSLGYQRQAAEKAIRAALQDAGSTQLTVEELLKRSLRHLS